MHFKLANKYYELILPQEVYIHTTKLVKMKVIHNSAKTLDYNHSIQHPRKQNTLINSLV